MSVYTCSVNVAYKAGETKQLRDLRNALAEAGVIQLDGAERFSQANPGFIPKLWFMLGLLFQAPPPKGSEEERAYWVGWKLAMQIAEGINDAVRDGKLIPAGHMKLMYYAASGPEERTLIKTHLSPHAEPGWDEGMPEVYRAA